MPDLTESDAHGMDIGGPIALSTVVNVNVKVMLAPMDLLANPFGYGDALFINVLGFAEK